MAKKFEQVQRHIFFDVGAGSTVTSLVSFKTASVKEQSKFSTKPRMVNVTQIEVEGIFQNFFSKLK